MKQDVLESNKTLTVGSILKSTREIKGYTIAEVVRFTKIRYSHIKFMENDDYSALPERTYTLGYIDKYCRFLGIDSQTIVKQVEQQYTLKNPLYNNMVQNNRLDKVYNPFNLIKESIIDFIFIVFTFGLKRYNTNKDPYLNKKDTPKKEFPFIFFVVVLILLGISIGLWCVKKSTEITIEEAPITMVEELSKDLDLIKVKKTLPPESKPATSINNDDMVLVKNTHHKDGLENEKIFYDANNAETKKTDYIKEKSNIFKLTPWPKANKPSKVVLLFNQRVKVKIYNKLNKDEVYLDGYFKEGDYFKVPNLPDLCMDVGNYNSLYLLVNNEVVYLTGSSNSVMLKKIDLEDSSLLSKYSKKDF